MTVLTSVVLVWKINWCKMSLQDSQSKESVELQTSLSHDYSSKIKKVYRARTRLIVCFWTLPIYISIVWFLLLNRQSVDLFMLFYFVLCASFWLDMAWRKCPACKKQFYVKSILLNLVTRKCVHCSVDMKSTGEY